MFEQHVCSVCGKPATVWLSLAATRTDGRKDWRCDDHGLRLYTKSDIDALTRERDEAVERTEQAKQEYRWLADAIEEHLNPRDGDESEVALLIEAVEDAKERAETAERERDEARAAFRKYGWHDLYCPAVQLDSHDGRLPMAGPCTCGFVRALAATEEKSDE